MGEQTARKKQRRRPIETCSSVILASARVVYTRVKTQKNSPSSYFVHKFFNAVIFLASLTSPFHRHFLAILSVADDHILALQNTIETYLPSSTYAFLKISDSLIAAENLPKKLDWFLQKLPCFMNRAMWIEWVLVHAISCLDSIVSVLDRWRDNNKGTKEKDITVDRSFSRTGSNSAGEDGKISRTGGKKATYKEALQRGSSGEDGGESICSSREDPILELFENGWIQNPIKRSSRSADSLTTSPSDSYSATT